MRQGFHGRGQQEGPVPAVPVPAASPKPPGMGMDRQTDTGRVRCQVSEHDVTAPNRTAKRRRWMDGQTPLCRSGDRATRPHSAPKPPHSRLSRTFACLPHVSAAGSLCRALWLCRRGRGGGARLPATSRPCALRGDTGTHTAAEGTAAVARGQSWPWDPPCMPGMLRGGCPPVPARRYLWCCRAPGASSRAG